MTAAGDRIREFCRKYGLTQQEQDYLLGVLGEAVLAERTRCASLARSYNRTHGGDADDVYREPSSDGPAIAGRIEQGAEAGCPVAAERERCRRVAQVWAEDADILSWSGREVAEFIARDIAGGA